MEVLKNQFLTVTISNRGAELQSIKDAAGHEYLWQGDPTYWGKRSPLLFPIVCGLWEETFRVDGKAYHMKRHGFASSSEFHLLSKSDDTVCYVLTSNEETLAAYPYHFALFVSYVLKDNHLSVVWNVENPNKHDLYFQIGGHPAFNIPTMREGDPLHGYLRLDNPKAGRLYGNTLGCISKGHHPLRMDGDVWEFRSEDFDDDALIFDESQLREVQLLDADKQPVVSLNFKSPALGIWSPTGKNAPFICIEPWYGIHDWVGFDGEFKDKYLMNKLLPGAAFMSRYEITIHQ